MLDELKNNKIIVGKKQSIKATEQNKVKKIFIAKDADHTVIEPFSQYTDQVEIEYVDTMKNLGRECGIKVGAAVAVVLKD